MSAGLSADPDGMRTAAGGFATVGDVVDDLGRALGAARDAEHQSWGADEPGVAFAEGYLATTKQVDELLAALAELMTAVRDGVVADADALEHSDSGGAGRLGGIAGGLDDGRTDCWPVPGSGGAGELLPPPVPFDPRDRGYVPPRPGDDDGGPLSDLGGAAGTATTTDGQAPR